jgi:hypothetical protein
MERCSMRPWARASGSVTSGVAGDVEGFQQRDDHPDLVGL